VLPAVPSSEVYLEDCVTALKRFNDNHFDLAIVDPPYGLGMGCGAGETRGDGKKKKDLYTPKKWDTSKPNVEYWKELFRVSKNQVVWGGNYFTDMLPVSRGWIYWRKMMGGNYSDGELAWTSFDMILKEYTKRSEQGDKRFHPTQKPVELYNFILHHYAKEGDLILDTHLGSGSSRIAAYKGGFNFVGFEIDQEYYEKQEKRFNDFKSQLRLTF
jgi:site-specific DNA-methyltransferase (adenine-specific)